MAETQKRPAKGAETFDFRGMPDGRFERMNALIIRLEYPKAFKPGNVGDGGADMVLARADLSGYERCWQSKHYPGTMRWGKCEKSLASAREHWDPDHYTFIFPRELTAKEEKTFQEKFGALDIKIDYWNAVELESRLLASDAGERIARMYFESPELERESMYQAIEAGGRLETPLDAIERTANIGVFLADRDPYFSYPASTHEVGQPASSPPPEAIMSVMQGDEKVRTRLDIVPRDQGAMELYGPQFILAAGTDDAGTRAAELLREALEEGKAVEIEEGLTLTFTRLPPALEALVGQPITGSVELGPAERTVCRPAPWRAQLSVSSAEGRAEIEIELKPMAKPPDDWGFAFQGEHGGLTVTLALRRRGEGGQMGLSFRYSRNRTPVREQLAALKFARAATAVGTVTITDVGGTGRPALQMNTRVTPMPEDLRELLAFFENVRVVEEWAGIEYELPEELTGQDAISAAVLARMIGAGGRDVTWRDFKTTVLQREAQLLKGGHVLRWERPVQASLLGRTDRLGFLRADLIDYKLVSAEDAPNEPGYVLACIQPTTDEASRVFEKLVKEPTAAGKATPLQDQGARQDRAMTAAAAEASRRPRRPKRRHAKKRASKKKRRRR